MQVNNRELSWLLFNERVLQEAQDNSVPLIQRLRFLGIFSNNQDEFIKVRMANLMRMNTIRSSKVIKTAEGFPVRDILAKVHQRIDATEVIFSETYRNIIGEMEKNNIFILNEKQLNIKQKAFCRDYFSKEISPLMVPLLLRKSMKMPFLSDEYIYHAVRMKSQHSKQAKYAVISIPVNSKCPRFVELPSSRGRKDLIFLDDIIRLCLDDIFFMFRYDEISAHTFKLIRDARLTVDDDITKSLMTKMEEGLEGRLHGEPVRLIYDREMPCDLLAILTSKLKLHNFKTQGGGRYHMMKHLMSFPLVAPQLEYERITPLRHPGILPQSSLIQIIRKKDLFLNFPYHTFDHVIDFLREAAIDPKVNKICISLYRTAERSKIIHVLMNAVENGKEVIVLEELMARFDEERNIENSDLLQKAGIKVIHGFKNLKVHGKIIYIERKEKHLDKGYAYIGTGNFNESTARQYTDFGILTSDITIVNDVRSVFEFLQNPHKHISYRSLLVAPYFMRSQFERLIENEIHNKKKGKNAYIYIKCNSLTDMNMIRLLYKASRAGVEIKLIIRGACSLIPQITPDSQHIRAISIVDQFLEHGRAFIFHNGGNDRIFIGSADWMTRNLDSRIEVAVPVCDPGIKNTILDIFRIQWSDNVKARDLSSIDQNCYINQEEKKRIRSQTAIYDYYKMNKPE